MDRVVNSCLLCQVTDKKKPAPAPVISNPLPEQIWHTLSIDFRGPNHTNEYLMVVTDEHSRYVVVEPLRSISAAVVIPRLDAIFSAFGVPNVVKSDNGPPFNGQAFSEFCKHFGVQFKPITPYTT